MSSNAFTSLPDHLRIPLLASAEAADAARAVRFDRPLVEQPGWADPRVDRRIAAATRAGREQGLAEGYAAGWAQGRQAAAERALAEATERAEREEATRRALTLRTQGMLAGLAQAARTVAEQVVPAWEDLVDTLLDGALAIAAAGFERELAALDAETLEAARTALRLLPTGQAVTVHVNPADLDLFAGTEAFEGLGVVPDATVPAGSVVARTALQSLPVDLRAALRAAEEVIHP